MPDQDISQRRWDYYYTHTQHRPPSDLLLKVVEGITMTPSHNDLAIDLGCGAGRDTQALLARGWQVLAIDSQSTALEITRNQAPVDYQTNLQTREAAFEGLTLPNARLIHAHYSLPFCHPDQFDALWQQIEMALTNDGCFSGTFFGPNDEWAGTPTMTFHTADDVRLLFERFQIMYFSEEDAVGKTAVGREKHWHVFSVVAQKVKRG
ncbi:MAG: class I SAM-dependent methyltransferase [Chloroflexota bacterium]